MAQEETGMAAAAGGAASGSAGADDARLADAVRAAETRSAEDHAALMRVRRKLIRTMMVALTTTFIALAIVIIAIVYKFAHDPAFTIHKKPQAAQAGQTMQAGAAGNAPAQAAEAENAPLVRAVSPFINTAPNSGADPEYFRQKQEQAAKAAQSVAPEQKLPLNAGDRLISEQVSGSQLLLRVRDAHGAESIIVYDIAQGKIITRIAVTGQ